ncbi:MAG: hypothetical protein OEN55_08125 [Alphaproteobacteria bacterium]|nr:hypothetical protein [Alphaproteobacteria bacterium]
MLDFLLVIFLIVLMISLYALLVSYRSRSRGDGPVYYTAENTAADESEDGSA